MVTLNWAIAFFVLAVIAAVLGFGGIAGTFVGIAKFLAILFVILFIISLIYSLLARRPPPSPLP